MKNRFLPKFVITTVTILSVFYFVVSLCSLRLLFAQSTVDSATGSISDLHEQARKYREAGLGYQNAGNLPEAMSLYQKAIAIDPIYADVYNDLGVVYEAAGFGERAEESYLKALKIDPAYLSAYSNLAFFYENKRDLEKAAFYWEKRAKLGSLYDPWTQKAIGRVKDIRAVLSNRTVSDEREEDVLSLVKDMLAQNPVLSKNDKALTQEQFRKAKLSYNKGDLATAVKEALDAQYLDQGNTEIEAFIDETASKALSR